MITKKKIGFIGSGVMTTALVKGLVTSEVTDSKNIFVSDVDQDKASELVRDYEVNFLSSNAEIVKKCEIIIIAVKPQNIEEVFGQIKKFISPQKIIISIAAGVTTTDMKKLLQIPDNKPARIIRVMPNTPAIVGHGLTVLYNASSVADDLKLADILFNSVGKTVIVHDEKLMDTVTGLSGSGPAFTFLFIDGLASGGVLGGLSRKEALLLAAQTVLGTAEMVLCLDEHPAELKDQVTSPGGTAIEGTIYLEKVGFRGICAETVRLAAEKSKKLGQLK